MKPGPKLSRQQERRAIFRAALDKVNARNLSRFGLDGEIICRGMIRSERRNLARAYAAGEWRELKSRQKAA
jgi:hypothetical protein